MLSFIFNAIAPDVCASCLALPPQNKELFCSRCIEFVFYTDSHLNHNLQNRGGDYITNIRACYRFTDPGPVRDMIHRGKYEHAYALLHRAAYHYTHLLMAESTWAYDSVVPIPIHPLRYLVRTYNQSLHIARGISRAAGIPVWQHALSKTRYTTSQTKKTRMQRLLNVKDTFRANSVVKGKRILLCDDLITTGATANHAAEELMKAGAAEVSLLALAAAV